MIPKDAYVETIERRLESWEDEIERLDAKADIILLQLEDKYYTLLRSLRGKEKEITTGLQQLKDAEEAHWQLLRPLVDGASKELQYALNTANQELETPHRGSAMDLRE